MQKNNVFLILTAVLFIISAVGVSAQSAAVVDELLGQETAKFGESVYMITVGSGLVDDSASIPEAMKAAAEEKWISSRDEAGDEISLGELSLLTMKAFKIHGGVMYMLFHSPRYAVRELAYLDIVRGEAHPGNTLSGEDVLDILSRTISMKGGN